MTSHGVPARGANRWQSSHRLPPGRPASPCQIADAYEFVGGDVTAIERPELLGGCGISGHHRYAIHKRSPSGMRTWLDDTFILCANHRSWLWGNLPEGVTMGFPPSVHR